jgi:hypothetical protein
MEGASTVLVSNAPARVAMPIASGLYLFGTFAATAQKATTSLNTLVRIKLGEAPPTQGTIPLHVFITDLAGGCAIPFGAASARAALGNFENVLKSIFAQSGLTIGPIAYADSGAASSISVPTGAAAPELDALLKQATTGDTPDALELVIVRQIANATDPNFEILGIAGGIPGSPGIPGTVHSGAAVSLSTLCADSSGKLFAITAAHELGHTLGLFHSVEQDGHVDPITDNDSDGPGNLMYWEENSGMHLSPQQGQVLLANPEVGP